MPILFMSELNKGNGAINNYRQINAVTGGKGGINARYVKRQVCKMRNRKREPAVPVKKNWQAVGICFLPAS
jgi:hypothetical protein